MMKPVVRNLLGLGFYAVIAAVSWSLMGAVKEPEFASGTGPGDTVLTEKPPVPAANSMSAGNEAAVLRRELAALREEVVLLRGRVMAQTVTRSEPEQPEDAGSDSTEVFSAKALEQAVQAAERRHADRLEAVESALLGESVDPDWSLQASRGIEQVFARGMFRQARLLGVECRASLCRVDVLHAGQADLPQFTASFPAEVAAYANRMTMRQTVNEDGSVTTVLYLGRDGYPFPA